MYIIALFGQSNETSLTLYNINEECRDQVGWNIYSFNSQSASIVARVIPVRICQVIGRGLLAETWRISIAIDRDQAKVKEPKQNIFPNDSLCKAHECHAVPFSDGCQ